MVTEAQFGEFIELFGHQKNDNDKFYENFNRYFKEIDTGLSNYFKNSLSFSKKSIDAQNEQFKSYNTTLSRGLEKTANEIKKRSEEGKSGLAEVARTIVGSILPQKAKDEKNQETITEQKNFGPKTTFVDFSPKTALLLKSIITHVSDEQGKANQVFEDYLNKSNEYLESISNNTTKDNSLLGLLGNLLLVGGVASALVGLFWKDKIKPWLEEKFNVKLGFFDKFQGIVESIGKFFTLGGLKLTGISGITSIVGKVFTDFGSLLENAIGSIFKDGLLKITGTPTGEKVVGKTFFGRILPKLAGGLFKGVGFVAMKNLPIIGGLISFGFGIKDFENNDPVSGVLNFVAGILNLMELIPGAAAITAPLSMGVTALNAILDFKASGNTAQERTASKLNILSSWGTKLFELLKKLPFIGNLISFGQGFGDFITGVVNGDVGMTKNALDEMAKLPILGLFPSIMSGILSSADLDSSGKITGFNWKQMAENVRKKISKAVISWFPYPFQRFIAKELGMDTEGEFLDLKLDDQTQKIIQGYQQVGQTQQEATQSINQKNPFDEQQYEKLKEQTKKLKEQYSHLIDVINMTAPPPEKYDFWKDLFSVPLLTENSEQKLRKEKHKAKDAITDIRNQLVAAEDTQTKYEQSYGIKPEEPEDTRFKDQPKVLTTPYDPFNEESKKYFEKSLELQKQNAIPPKTFDILFDILRDIKTSLKEQNKDKDKISPVIVNNNSSSGGASYSSAPMPLISNPNYRRNEYIYMSDLTSPTYAT